MRRLCPHCRLTAAACLCSSARPLQVQTQVWVLQHPAERDHPKNTLRLARLCLPDIHVLVGETPEDFRTAVAALSPAKAVLCYPDPTSVALESRQPVASQLVFIDATWRKAHKILQLNPWLQQLPRCHFNAAPVGEYRLRKTRRAGGLSTLEAIAHGLNSVEAGDYRALYEVQALWVARVQGFMPKAVRQRYEP